MYRIIAVMAMLITISGCTPSPRYTRTVPVSVPAGADGPSKTARPYVVDGKTYEPMESVSAGKVYRGNASYYGDDFHGRPTANGETFDMHGLTAAHKTLPINTWVEVKNLANGRTVIVRVNDRGPFVDGRIIDLSYGAAQELHMVETGVQEVEITVLR